MRRGHRVGSACPAAQGGGTFCPKKTGRTGHRTLDHWQYRPFLERLATITAPAHSGSHGSKTILREWASKLTHVGETTSGAEIDVADALYLFGFNTPQHFSQPHDYSPPGLGLCRVHEPGSFLSKQKKRRTIERANDHATQSFQDMG